MRCCEYGRGTKHEGEVQEKRIRSVLQEEEEEERRKKGYHKYQEQLARQNAGFDNRKQQLFQTSQHRTNIAINQIIIIAIIHKLNQNHTQPAQTIEQTPLPSPTIKKVINPSPLLISHHTPTSPSSASSPPYPSPSHLFPSPSLARSPHADYYTAYNPLPQDSSAAAAGGPAP